MAKIPAFAYLLVGALVAYVSLRIGETFTFFFYVGLVFLGIGLAKLLIGFLLRKKETKTEKKLEQPAKPANHIRYCPRCRSACRMFDYFCWRCGTRLR
ncbi:hypothetical protein HY492_00010 [Candidatus Woesearchaeota archaeon]|nr:hypothetical protein [Candidatus Woesearchaeota archaeon]